MSQILLDPDTLALVQKGAFVQPQFYGNQAGTSSHQVFQQGMEMIGKFSGFADLLREQTVVERNPDDKRFSLTEVEYKALTDRAAQISKFANVPTDAVEDFLFMLSAVTEEEVLFKIADAVQLPALADSDLLRNPLAIAQLPGLERISYISSALQAVLKSYSRYSDAASATVAGMDDIGSIINSLGSLLGGFGSGNFTQLLDTPAPNKAVGNFMSELITGKRIPMSVIAKNPQLQSPSFIGRAMFGEAPIPLSNVDIKALFNKKIGVFPKASSGGATTTFGVTNFNSFASAMSVDQFVSKVMFNTTNVSPTSHKYSQKEAVLAIVREITGAASTEVLETNRADNIIPMMTGLAGGLAGLEKAPFSIDTFQQAWVTSMSASNVMQVVNPEMMEAFRKLV